MCLEYASVYTTVDSRYMYMHTVYIISSVSQNHKLSVHYVYIKPGGVPGKLCVFPADES